MEGIMHDSQHYRCAAADCLIAAQDAQRPRDRKLRLSMANSWLSLARQDEAMATRSRVWIRLRTGKPWQQPDGLLKIAQAETAVPVF